MAVSDFSGSRAAAVTTFTLDESDWQWFGKLLHVGGGRRNDSSNQKDPQLWTNSQRVIILC